MPRAIEMKMTHLDAGAHVTLTTTSAPSAPIGHVLPGQERHNGVGSDGIADSGGAGKATAANATMG